MLAITHTCTTDHSKILHTLVERCSCWKWCSSRGWPGTSATWHVLIGLDKMIACVYITCKSEPEQTHLFLCKGIALKVNYIRTRQQILQVYNSTSTLFFHLSHPLHPIEKYQLCSFTSNGNRHCSLFTNNEMSNSNSL